MGILAIILVILVCLLAILVVFLYLMGNPDPAEPEFIRRIRFHQSAIGEYLALFAHGLFHPRLLRSGATKEEKRMPFPGDDLVKNPIWQATRGVNIDAPLDCVWPWLVQMGGGRGGWYWWVPLSAYPDFAAEHITIVNEILPQFQKIEVGDRLSDGGPAASDTRGNWEVKEVEKERHIVLYAARQVLEGGDFDHGEHVPKGLWFICGWVFRLMPLAENRTRLLVRVRAIGGPRLLFGFMKFTFGYGDTVAHITMFDALKERAEMLHLRQTLEEGQEED